MILVTQHVGGECSQIGYVLMREIYVDVFAITIGIPDRDRDVLDAGSVRKSFKNEMIRLLSLGNVPRTKAGGSLYVKREHMSSR